MDFEKIGRTTLHILFIQYSLGTSTEEVRAEAIATLEQFVSEGAIKLSELKDFYLQSYRPKNLVEEIIVKIQQNTKKLNV